MPGAVSTDLNNHMTGEAVKTPEKAAEWIVGLILDKKIIMDKLSITMVR